MLTPRLQIIIDNIKSNKIADIGTDHAYIPIELSKTGKYVIATDISKGPLRSAAKNIGDNNKNIELRLGAGLEPLKSGEAEEIIIAGMGGEMIQSIISDSLQIAQASRLLLQPMKGQAELRKFLLTNNFVIEKEALASEGSKIYNLIIARKGAGYLPESEIDFHIPKYLSGEKDFPQLVSKKKREFKKQYEGLKKSNNQDTVEIERLEKLLKDLSQYETV